VRSRSVLQASFRRGGRSEWGAKIARRDRIHPHAAQICEHIQTSGSMFLLIGFCGVVLTGTAVSCAICVGGFAEAAGAWSRVVPTGRLIVSNFSMLETFSGAVGLPTGRWLSRSAWSCACVAAYHFAGWSVWVWRWPICGSHPRGRQGYMHWIYPFDLRLCLMGFRQGPRVPSFPYP